MKYFLPKIKRVLLNVLSKKYLCAFNKLFVHLKQFKRPVVYKKVGKFGIDPDFVIRNLSLNSDGGGLSGSFCIFLVLVKIFHSLRTPRLMCAVQTAT